MTASITITPRLHWMTAGSLCIVARAVVRVDGVDVSATWGQPLRVELPAGRHEVAAGARFHGLWGPFGMTPLRVEVQDGQDVVLEARNGPLLSMLFTIAVRGFRPMVTPRDGITP